MRYTLEMKLDEQSLKCELLAMFRRQRLIGSSSVIASEFVLGRTGCRSDLAIWNGQFIGIEVKSARDSLSRLPEQLQAYLKFFDEVILLCDETHLVKADALCPAGVGIYVWQDDEIKVYRSAQTNIRHDEMECARHLSVKNLQSALGLKPGHGYSRTALERQLLNASSICIKSLVKASFKSTYRCTTEIFLNATKRKSIKPEHLRHLSRYADSREEQEKNYADRKTFWRQWEQQAQAVFG
ncbi:sce7726 family protein [Agrobacterium fabrum]|uniref:sce7726 family protein n=1 Tax=Agrobacterium fabrum TaxID=1176649 RepID=UPI000DD33401|nr:sce7726 family protein [Agrobacterium fabrum]NTE60129.1 sce7726 family protein [Agrobacterium fabrum]